MTSLLKIGLILAAVGVILVLVQPAEADEDVKRKRVIIKVPHRVKHIYHHHTKKVHVHKTKPKPKPKKKKPHKHVVVVEEEEIVQPIKSWKSMHQAFKGYSGWKDWEASPSGFKHSIKHPHDFGGSGEHYEEDFSFEDDHDARESKHYGRGTSYKGGNYSSRSKGSRGKKRGVKPTHSYKSYSSEDPSYEASYEVHHHVDSDYEPEYERPRRKPKSRSPKTSSRGYTSKKKRPSSYRTSSRSEEKHLEADEYDELYDRGPAYPERKEHPSWHERSKQDLGELQSGSHPKKSVWTAPPVSEFIDDAKDTPEPVLTYPNSGGFVPITYDNPITTITSSVVQNTPSVPKTSSPYLQPQPPRSPSPYIAPPLHDQPPSPTVAPRVKLNKKQKKNPGYVSQVSHTPDGRTVKYQSHIGHSSDVKSPSSSFQSVSYGNIKTRE